jgi:GntR family transcriptional regulator
MFIVISAQNPDPMYKQVMDQIKDAIAVGALKPDERLPSIREMAKDLRISEITIKRAYMDLESEGFIITRAGLGSFVATINKETLREQKMAEIREELRRIVGLGQRFGITPEEIVAILKGIKKGQ